MESEVHTAEVARSKPERHGNTAKGRLLLGLLTSVWLLRPGFQNVPLQCLLWTVCVYEG